MGKIRQSSRIQEKYNPEQVSRDDKATRHSPRIQNQGSEDWKVYSINMQGMSGDAEKGQVIRRLMQDPKALAICLQECGSLNGWTDDQAPAKYQWKGVYHHEWTATDDGNRRCSLGILTRVESEIKVVPSTAPTARPMLVATLKNGWILCNIHAPSGGNAEYLASAFRIAARYGQRQKWLVVGDCNLNPSGVEIPREAKKIFPAGATHIGGGKLDWGVGTGEFDAGVARWASPDHAVIEFTRQKKEKPKSGIPYSKAKYSTSRA
jgi:hypothetical protein